MFSRRILKLPASITPAAIAASRYWFGRTPSAPAGRSRAVVTRALPKACVIVGDRGPNARLWGPKKQVSNCRFRGVWSKRAGGLPGRSLTMRIARRKPAETIAPEVYPTDAAPDDHGLHVSDETCARCGRDIRPGDEARRTATGSCVHLSC